MKNRPLEATLWAAMAIIAIKVNCNVASLFFPDPFAGTHFGQKVVILV